jgi:hypothetical protein
MRADHDQLSFGLVAHETLGTATPSLRASLCPFWGPGYAQVPKGAAARNSTGGLQTCKSVAGMSTQGMRFDPMAAPSRCVGGAVAVVPVIGQSGGRRAQSAGRCSSSTLTSHRCGVLSEELSPAA